MHLQTAPGIESRVCVTAQHRQMLDQVLELFEIVPDHDLDLMRPGQDLSAVTSDILLGAAAGVRGRAAATSCWCRATRRRRSPRRSRPSTSASRSAMSRPACAPATCLALARGSRTAAHGRTRAAALRADRQARATTCCARTCPRSRIIVTGNTVIDALLMIRASSRRTPALNATLAALFPYLRDGARLLLVTGHRRENFGDGFERSARRIAALARRYPETGVRLSRAPEPERAGARRPASERHRQRASDRAAGLPALRVPDDALDLIITDSGGIQEEAPSLGKPVLVMRDTTERPEAVEAGTVRLVGTDVEAIVAACRCLLDDAAEYRRMASPTTPTATARPASASQSTLLSFGG